MYSGSFVSTDGGQTFVFQIVPDQDALAIEMRLPKGQVPTMVKIPWQLIEPLALFQYLAKDELTNWWWFNEALGTVASDSIGSNDGVLNGGVKWTAMQKKELPCNLRSPGR